MKKQPENTEPKITALTEGYMVTTSTEGALSHLDRVRRFAKELRDAGFKGPLPETTLESVNVKMARKTDITGPLEGGLFRIRLFEGEALVFTHIGTLEDLSRIAAEFFGVVPKPPVRAPSAVSVPQLFTAGAPQSDLLKTFDVFRNTDDGGETVGYGIEMKLARARGDEANLSLFAEPEVLSSIASKKGRLPQDEWKREVLATIHARLGPEALALYFWTWAEVNDTGAFVFEPSAVLGALGMRNSTEARDRITKLVDVLTRVKLTIKRRHQGPGAKLPDAIYEGCLIDRSSESITLKSHEAAQDGSRGPRRLQIYRHAQLMLAIQREFYVEIPRDAFRLVGEWRPGKGTKEDGYRALALVANAYVLARTFASKTGTQGDVTYRGPEGFEMPLEDVLTRSGFVTPKDFVKNPGFNTARARDAVRRLVYEFGFFGDGSEVFGGKDGTPMFRFVSPEKLKGALSKIAHDRPILIEEAREASKKGRRRRPRRPKTQGPTRKE